MTFVDLPSPLFPMSGSEFASLALLVSAEGVILGGDASHFGENLFRSALSVILDPYDEVDFAAWWRGLTERAAEPGRSPVQSRAWLKWHSDRFPITLTIGPITGRDEFLVTGLLMAYPPMSLSDALHGIGVAMARLDLDGVLAAVRQKIGSLMRVDGFYIALYDQEAGLIHFREVVEDGRYLGDTTVTLLSDAGLVGWVLANRKSLVIGDLERDPLPVEVKGRGSEVTRRSALLVPMIAHGDIVGALSVQSHQPDAYGEGDVWLLDAIAAQTAVAVHHVRLGEKTASHLATLTSLQNTAQLLSSAYDQRSISEVVGQAVLGLLMPDEVRVYLREAADQPLRFIAGQTAGGLIPLRADPEGGSMVALIDEQGTPFILHDAQGHPGLVGDFDWPPAAVAGYPIWRGEQRYGVIVLLYKERRFFRQDEQRALNLMADQAAIAVENVHYRVDLVRRYEEVSALYMLAQQITGQLNSDEILTRVVTTLRDIFDCRACVIALREDDEVVIRAAVGVKKHWQDVVRWKVGEGVAGKVVQTGQPIYVPDVHADPAQPVFDPEVHSLLAVPIAFQGRVIGSLNLDSRVPNAFMSEHERILTIAAAQVAAALENARLYRAEAERAQKLVEANQELQTLEDLRDELIQNLAHELRTPLTYLKGYSSLLLDGVLGKLSDEQRSAVRIIADKSGVLERLIRDVVLLEQISEETLNREEVDVNELARRALEAARLIHGAEKLHFEMDLTDEACWVLGDRSRISQVIDNLLNNAVKFTPAGGVVVLQTRISPDGREVRVSISDTGIGIAPEYIDRIFERFYQIKDPARGSAGGSGIGLAIVQRVLEAHHGRIWVTSKSGEGSVFTFALPRLERQATDDV